MELIIIAIISGVIGPLISGIITYKITMSKNDTKLEALEKSQESELKRIEAENKAVIDKIKAEQKEIRESKEHGAQMDLIAQAFGNPKTKQALDSKMAKELEKLFDK
ncbi:hypothetical protein [Alkalibacillus haloalkaliphilus]|uniref:hypothetical protein n=1 Tax=Alkalibacillus haloalkaliphilus TaxID=94136 RepID=UPI0029357FB6|nr:hypothetical protein [Alkalibacillus haloalkaliphilus]MDV2580685.1 hypothetical protein [Alkalibacillus haloalkaliphilus]